MKYVIVNSWLVLLLVAVGCNDGSPQTGNRTPTSPGVAADGAAKRDNTEVNVRDGADAAKTPLDQNENQKDIDITANIRKRVMDSDMSVNAQNAKIITQNGKVTLLGPVKSDAEKSQIEKLARDVAGPDNVISQLEVQP